MNCNQPGSSVHGIFQQQYWSKSLFPPEDVSDPGIEPRTSCTGRKVLYCWATWEDHSHLYFLNIFYFYIVSKITFHLQLLQTIDYIPGIAQYILEPIIYRIVYASQSPDLTMFL